MKNYPIIKINYLMTQQHEHQKHYVEQEKPGTKEYMIPFIWNSRTGKVNLCARTQNSSCLCGGCGIEWNKAWRNFPGNGHVLFNSIKKNPSPGISGVRDLNSWPPLHYLLVMAHWAKYVPSVSLRFLIWKWGSKHHLPHSHGWGLKWFSACKSLSIVPGV